MPLFQNFTESAGGSGTSRAVNVPAGAATGNIMLVFAYMETTATVTRPTGFTELTPIVSVTGTEAHTLRVFWKRLTGADTGTYSFSWTGSAYNHFWCARYTDVVTTGSPFDVVNSAVRASVGTTFPATSVTTTGADRLLVHCAFSFEAGTCVAPSGFTSRDTGDINLSDKAQATAGASGSVTGTGPSGFMTAWLGALLPVVVASPHDDHRVRQLHGRRDSGQLKHDSLSYGASTAWAGPMWRVDRLHGHEADQLHCGQRHRAIARRARQLKG